MSAVAPILPRRLIVADVVDHVAWEFGVDAAQVRSPSRRKWLAQARYATAWLARRHTRANVSAIGRALGGRNHSTILHAIRRGEELREASLCFRRLTDNLDTMLRAA